MKNKNIGIATLIIALFVAIIGFLYYYEVSTVVTQTINSDPNIPLEVPNPNPQTLSKLFVY